VILSSKYAGCIYQNTIYAHDLNNVWTHFRNAKKKGKENTTQVNRWKNNWAPVHHKVISDCLYHQAVVIKREGRGKGKSHPAQPLSKLRETGQLFFRVKEPVIVKEETAGRIDTALLKPFCTSNLIKERETNAPNRCFITIRNHADRVAIMAGYPERVTRSARALFNEKPTGCPHQTHPLTLFSSAL